MKLSKKIILLSILFTKGLVLTLFGMQNYATYNESDVALISDSRTLELFDFIRANDIEGVVRVLHAVPKEELESFVLTRFLKGHTFLCFAAVHADIEIAKLLIDAISPEKRFSFINAREKTGLTAFNFAVIHGNVKLVAFLLDSVSEKEGLELILARRIIPYKTTVLHDAAFFGLAEVAELLLTRIPVDIRAKFISTINIDGLTSLHLAVINNREDVVRVLMHSLPENQREALVMLEAFDGRMALDIAVSKRKISMAKILLGIL